MFERRPLEDKTRARAHRPGNCRPSASHVALAIKASGVAILEFTYRQLNSDRREAFEISSWLMLASSRDYATFPRRFTKGDCAALIHVGLPVRRRPSVP